MSTTTLTPPTTPTEPPIFALIGLDDETIAVVEQHEQERERRRRAEAGLDTTTVLRGGTDVRDFLSAYDDLDGKRVIDHRGTAWTSVGKDCPGYWVNDRGVYRHHSYLANKIAKERH